MLRLEAEGSEIEGSRIQAQGDFRDVGISQGAVNLLGQNPKA